MHVNFPPEVDAQRFRGHAVLIAAAEQSRNRETIGWSQLRSAEQWSKTDQKKLKVKNIQSCELMLMKIEWLAIGY